MDPLQCLTHYEGNYIILSAILGIACPLKANVFIYCASPNKSMYLPEKICLFWWPFQHIITTLLSNWVDPYTGGVLVTMRICAKLGNERNGVGHGVLPYIIIFYSNYSTSSHWSHFVIKLPHIVVPAPLCDSNFSKSNFAIFSRLFNCACLTLQYLPLFEIPRPVCNKDCPWPTKYAAVYVTIEG